MATQDTKQSAPAADETIMVTRTTLEKLEARIEELELAAMVSAETPALPPPTEMGPKWAFLHESAPAFSIPLPKEMKHLTQDGSINFWADVTTVNGKRSRFRPRRGKFSTRNAELGQWLLGEIQKGNYKGVMVDTEATRVKLQEDEIAYLSA